MRVMSDGHIKVPQLAGDVAQHEPGHVGIRLELRGPFKVRQRRLHSDRCRRPSLISSLALSAGAGPAAAAVAGVPAVAVVQVAAVAATPSTAGARSIPLLPLNTH